MAAPVVASVGATAAGTGAANCAAPAGVQPGDLCLMIGSNLSTTALNTSEPGFALLASEVSDTPAIRVWWKEADGSEDATWSVTGNALNNMGGLAMRITGWKGGSDFIGDIDTGRLASGTALPDVELVDQALDSLGIHIVSFSASKTFTPETGWTQDTAGGAQRIGVAHTDVLSGDTGVVNGSINTGAGSVGMLLAIEPAVILPSAGSFLGLL